MSACCDTPAFVPPAAPPPPAALKTVVLIGPPNSGKSTLFNRLTGLRQKVANYPGVTVEQRMGLMAGVGRDDLTLIDLPGIYSLTPYSEDARVSIDVLRGKMPGTPKPDAVILVLDSLHLTRQLMLAAPVLAVGLPTLVLLNMSDLMESRGGHIDSLKLARELGAPVAQISATHGTGLDAVPLFLNQQTDREAASPSPCRSSATPPAPTPGPRRSAAAPATRPRSRSKAPARSTTSSSIASGGRCSSSSSSSASLRSSSPSASRSPTALATSSPASATSSVPLLPAGWLQSLLLDGAWKGISSVLVFLPQILLLFLFIGILEDSGYLARAALIADRVMRTIGLNGKAFIPLLSAYACAVPAIMATRTIENKRDRLATILVTPFMTCSARLPVYMLLIAAFIPNTVYLHGFLGLRTIVMLSLYLAGFVGAMTTAWLLKSSILKSSETPFILELPQYRMPTLRMNGPDAQGGHAVLRQFEDEGRFAGFEDGAFEQPGGGHGADKAGQIEAEHDDGAQAEEAVEVGDVGDEGGDEQHVDGQARRAGHEGRDEDGGEAVALVLDGARGHDGGNGAGVGGEQGNEGLAVESDGAHDAVGDERGAGQVAGVFEDSDEEEQQQNLRQEDEHGGDALPCAVEQQRLQPAGGQQGTDEFAHAGEDVAEAVGERLADGEDHFKDADDDDEKQQRPPDAMEEDVVDLAGVLGGERGAVAGAAADLRGPGVGAGGVAEHGQGQRLGGCRARSAD